MTTKLQSRGSNAGIGSPAIAWTCARVAEGGGLYGNQRLMLGLFVCFGAVLALATGKLPALTISASSPLFAWIALEAYAAKTSQAAPRWALLAAAFWLSLAGSLAINVIWGDLGSLGRQELVLLARYAFWLLVFLTTAAVTTYASWTPRLCQALAAIAVALGMLRLADAAIAGEPWLDQNDYGLRFSAFLPFVLAACLSHGGWIWTSGLALTVAAFLGNGSRSSWVAAAVAAAVLLGLHAAAGLRLRGAVGAFVVAPAVLACALWLGPQTWTQAWTERVLDRLESFNRLSTDKPFQTRLALLDKGALLFRAQPLFGAGLGRFSLERVELDSGPLHWTSNEVFNTRSSHNAYLSLLAETGLAGTICFALMLACLLLHGVRAAYRLALEGRAWAAGIFASTLAVSIHLWTLAGLTGTLPWFVFGLMAGAIERERRGSLA